MQELQCTQCWFSRDTYLWQREQNLKRETKKGAAWIHWDSQSRQKWTRFLLQKLEVIRIQFYVKFWTKSKSNTRTNWFNIESILLLGTQNCIFRWPVKFKVVSPVPFFCRKGYFVGWNVGENPHRRLFSTCLSMFVKCVIIIVYLESKQKIHSNEPTFSKPL